MSKFVILNHYKTRKNKDINKFTKSYIWEGICILNEYYSFFDCTILIAKMEKGGAPVYCYSGNNLWSGIVFIDPEAGFKENYQNKDRETIARVHCANIKKANIPIRQKKLMDFVLGIAHEIGHLRLAQGRTKPKEKYDIEADTKLTQLLEYEAEREVYFLANELKYKNQKWLDIIEPEPIHFEHNLKDTLFYVQNKQEGK